MGNTVQTTINKARHSERKSPKESRDALTDHLISYASGKDGFDNNSSGLSSHNTEAKSGAIVDQLNRFHVLPLGVVNEKVE